VANQAEKRQKSFDKVVEEWKRKVADLQGELERSQRESRTHAAEVYKLRAQLDETHETVEAVRRENKNLTGQQQTCHNSIRVKLVKSSTNTTLKRKLVTL